jgi:NAD(P)-dependent dehydrogenase (short-subunit alcohol dehydrogenase family)
MEKACLVTGKSGPLLVEIVQRATARHRQTLVTRSGRLDLGQTDDESISTISWNRRSALSARSVLLHASNLFGRLDEAIVIFAPTHDTATFHESSIVGIEDRVDAEVKGYLYILRELFSQMVRQGAGRVALVLQEPPEELQSPLEATGVGSFAALAEALDRYYQNEPVTIHRFRTEVDDAPGFANFILDKLDADQGPTGRAQRGRRRWIHYPAGPQFLTRLKK